MISAGPSWTGFQRCEKLRRSRVADPVLKTAEVSALDDERATLHIRCGTDIERGLGVAGYVGAFLSYSNPWCHGPVPAEPMSALLRTRAAFIAEAYEDDLDSVRSKLTEAEAALDGVAAYERLVLWFEHDSYDQLILASVLARLRAAKHPCVELVCIDSFPGHPNFAGLGELEPAELRTLWGQRRPVTRADYQLGSQVWDALRGPDPTALAALAAAGTTAIPPMAGALKRHLMELPWLADGLSLTQRLIVQSVRDGCDRVGPIFGVLSRGAEPLPFLGDVMFWWEVRQLALGGALKLTATTEPWPRWAVRLTDVGTAILDGTADWMSVAVAERWVGGVCTGSTHPDWRWDPGAAHPRLR